MLKFKDKNIKPFMSKNHRFEQELFTAKFSAALQKIVHIKSIGWDIKPESSDIIRGESLESVTPGSYITSFSYGAHHNLGHIIIGPALTSHLIHKLLGGSDKVHTIQATYTDPSPIDQRTLATFHNPLSLCLREALTPSLLLNDAVIDQSYPTFDFALNPIKNYFYESFSISAPMQGHLAILLSTDPFKKTL